MIINTANLAALFTSYNAAFQNAFRLAEPMWSKVATEVPSGSEINLYAFLGKFPSLRQWVGDRHIKNMAAHDYSVTNLDFESTVGVPKPKIEDDTFGVFSTLFADMGYAAKIHPDELIFAKAAAGATDLCYDGQPFFNASHPVTLAGVATTASNYDSVSTTNLWVLLDTRRPLKPFIFQKRKDYKFQAFTRPNDEHVFMKNEFLYGVDARAAAAFGLWQMAYGSLNDLDATNYEAYLATMLAYRSDEEDKPLGVRPNICLVGPSNYNAARALFETDRLASGAANIHFKEVEIVLTPHLS